MVKKEINDDIFVVMVMGKKVQKLSAVTYYINIVPYSFKLTHVSFLFLLYFFKREFRRCEYFFSFNVLLNIVLQQRPANTLKTHVILTV